MPLAQSIHGHITPPIMVSFVIWTAARGDLTNVQKALADASRINKDAPTDLHHMFSEFRLRAVGQAMGIDRHCCQLSQIGRQTACNDASSYTPRPLRETCVGQG
ncbi:hypothetical protein BDW71DRAFT_80807 [Aspergillus fruticulosus]